jgi:Domain of unknown function (DUF932)
MTHQWHKGILNASSWHGLEEVGELLNADHLIQKGEDVGSYPTQVAISKNVTVNPFGGDYIPSTSRSVVGQYKDGTVSVLGSVGDKYNATTPDEWRSIIRAAGEAGAKPTGAFSLAGGSKVLATFEVDQASTGSGIRTNLMLCDSFDGSVNLTCGFTSIRVVCANTLSAALRSDGKAMAKIRHTRSLSEKVEALGEAIIAAIDGGKAIREMYQNARKYQLTGSEMDALMDSLFPVPEVEGRGRTRALNKREEMYDAMILSENQDGNTLASVWNGATWLVDRNVDGSSRRARGDADRLDSLLFGQRGKRILDIQSVVQAMLDNGAGALPTIIDVEVVNTPKLLPANV